MKFVPCIRPRVRSLGKDLALNSSSTVMESGKHSPGRSTRPSLIGMRKLSVCGSAVVSGSSSRADGVTTVTEMLALSRQLLAFSTITV